MSRFDLHFPRSHNLPVSKGLIKQNTDDFYVEELMDISPAGEGEHVWLWLEKDGQNTEFVGRQLARFAGVRAMDVGVSGLKDRWAVTRQWFSVYLGNRPEPDWSSFALDGVTVLKHDRHTKKLRRGEHRGNHFRIAVRQIEALESLSEIMMMVQSRGFPNYFGIQRFGREGANLDRALKWVRREIKASRSQKGFYLSAARSYLFNANLAREIVEGSWLNDTVGGPLYGDPSADVPALSAKEESLLAQYPEFAQLIHQNRLKLERRPYRIVPESMSWSCDGDMLIADFSLPSGVFATSLLAECMDVCVARGEV